MVGQNQRGSLDRSPMRLKDVLLVNEVYDSLAASDTAGI